MIFILFRTFISALRSHRALALEHLALRHQLDVLKRNTKRPHLTNRDRVLWVFLSRHWANWRESLTLVQPETVIRWHRRGFRLYWKWKSRPRWPGRSKVPVDVRNLIRQMSRDNPLWGRPGFTASCSSSASRSATPRSRSTWFAVENLPPRAGERS